MNRFSAICPFCRRTIVIEENLSGGYACPSCGQALGLQYLKDNKLIIDVYAERDEYLAAMDYFYNTDFREALRHFEKVLAININNYRAEYYMRLCRIYEAESDRNFDTAKSIMDAVKYCVEKMKLSVGSVIEKTDFLRSMLNEVYIILLNKFNRESEYFQDKTQWQNVRNFFIDFASNVNVIVLYDKEELMAFDKDIAKHLVNICDLGISACQKVVEPHILDNKYVDVPTEFEYSKVKSLHHNFDFFATSIDAKYSFENYRPSYDANLLYNESVITLLNKYNEDNRKNYKKYLSNSGRQLDTVVFDCQLAVKYSYYTCFKGLVKPLNEKHIAVVNESIAFGFEALKPRISISENKHVSIGVKNFAKASEVAFYLNAFIADFSQYNKRLAAEYVNRFYEELYQMIKLYYSIVYSSHNKFINKLKDLQNSEFRYYKNFLYEVTCCCSLALKQIIDYDQHKLATRLKILKLGKEVTEEFLLLSDYRLKEIENSDRYRDILDVYNYFDDSIEALSD